MVSRDAYQKSSYLIAGSGVKLCQFIKLVMYIIKSTPAWPKKSIRTQARATSGKLDRGPGI